MTPPPWPFRIELSLRARVVALLLIIVTAIVTMSAAVGLSIVETDRQLERIRVAQAQAIAMTALARHANRYSEQIAEMLLIVDAERADFDSARAAVSAKFDELYRLSALETALLGRAGRADQAAELERLTRLRGLYRSLDRAAERLFLLRAQGRPDEAVALFRSEIENRLDAELQGQIDRAVADEREEALRAQLSAERFHARLAVLVGAIALVLLPVGLVAVLALARAIAEPVRQLGAGAAAFGRGDLEHRIAYSRDDELGRLAVRFNAMAAELAAQRDLLVQSRAALELEVEGRTAELAEANRRLIELDRTRARFLADIGHELRTPLTILRGEAEVALRGGTRPAAPLRAALQQVVVQAASLGRLIEDLILLARADADQIRFQPERVDLAAIAAEAVRDARVLSARSGVAIALDEPVEALMVQADAGRLKQALLILLDNAVKYARGDTPVEVSLMAGAGFAEVRVSNPGGLPEGEAARLFDRFSRGGPAGEVGGLGLGLSIAKWVVEQLGGEIALAEREGRVEACVRIALAPMPARQAGGHGG